METTLPPRLPVAANLSFGELADAYMLAYRGRDTGRGHRVDFWKAQLGALPVLDITADHIDAGVIELEQQPARTFIGRRTDGSAIYRPRKGPLTQTTINRYLAMLGAVLSWARKRRLLPRQWSRRGRPLGTGCGCSSCSQSRLARAKARSGRCAGVT